MFVKILNNFNVTAKIFNLILYFLLILHPIKNGLKIKGNSSSSAAS
jgi:hypothetical protein